MTALAVALANVDAWTLGMFYLLVLDPGCDGIVLISKRYHLDRIDLPAPVIRST